MLSLTVIVIIVAAVSGLVNIKSEERQVLQAMILGADQLSRGITSATWHAMLADHREAAYKVMETIALKQGIDRIRMFNRGGQVMFSTAPEDRQRTVDKREEVCAGCHSPGAPRRELDLPSRVRIFRAAGGRRNLAMVTPIYNEPSCSDAACHAHPAEMKVLGVLDVALSLETVDRDVAAMKLRVLAVTAVEITLISLFIFYFTRRFLIRPIGKLIDGANAVSQMELDKPLDLKDSSQELDELAHAFDVMRERLRVAMGELNQFTQTLEVKVKERTEQLQAAQKKLLQTDRLASLGTLAASVAHEINNPVSGVLNLSMLMQRMLRDEGVPPERLTEFRRYLGQVTSETTRVGRIVSDLLAFSRRSKPQRTTADLNKTVRLALSLVQHKMKLANVEVVERLAPDLPQIRCDPGQIQQVTLNLLLNAAEATQVHGGGVVTVSTGLSTSDGVATLSVRDDGEGIQPENLARIFDPFFTTKSDGKGVGLGLAVTYGIVQEHGGEIEVRSEARKGAEFIVTLPVTPVDAVAAPAGRAVGNGG
jgi:two-component system NtrC family sensor kinase